MARIPSSGNISLAAVTSEFGTASLGTSLRGTQITSTSATAGIDSAKPINLRSFAGSTSVRFNTSIVVSPLFVDQQSGLTVNYSSTVSATKSNDWTSAMDYDVSVNSTDVSTTESIAVSSSSNVFTIPNAPASNLVVGNNPIRFYNSTFQPSFDTTVNITGHNCTANWSYSGSATTTVTPPGVAVTSTCTVPQPSTPNPDTCTPNPPTPGTAGLSVSGTCGSYGAGPCHVGTGFTLEGCNTACAPAGVTCSTCTTPPTANDPTCVPTAPTPNPSLIFPANTCQSFTLLECNTSCAGLGCGPCPDTSTTSSVSGTFSSRTRVQALSDLGSATDNGTGSATVSGGKSNSNCPTYTVTA